MNHAHVKFNSVVREDNTYATTKLIGVLKLWSQLKTAQDPKKLYFTCECLVHGDLLIVVPLPFDVRLGRSGRLAGEGLVGALANYDVAAAQGIVDVWWHCRGRK